MSMPLVPQMVVSQMAVSQMPGATGWYSLVYGVTFLLHALFMSYVLAGALMLGVAGVARVVRGAAPPGRWTGTMTVLKDWMPFALSGAITAGVAPLLFVQILYQQEFYTANLLSFHRWMAILPVLIVAFYLLYVLKAHGLDGRARLRGLVAMVIALCVLFVAWSWVENHLLSLDRESWGRQYQTRAMFYANPAILPRIVLWIAAAIPTAAVMLAWQLRAGASGVPVEEARRSTRALAIPALVGLGAALAAAWPVLTGVVPPEYGPAPAMGVVLGMVLLGAGAVAQAVVWVRVATGRATGGAGLAAASVGALLLWAGAILARETARSLALARPELYERHERVATTGGLFVFLVCAVLGVGAVVWVVRMVARGVRNAGGTGLDVKVGTKTEVDAGPGAAGL